VLDGGGFAVGVEGSDYSLVRKRAEWAHIPGNLLTADITEPFKICREDGTRLKFNVITAWEVCEHIAEDRIDAMIRNVLDHLDAGGVLLCSIASFEHMVNGVKLHQTVQEVDWWIDRFASLGLVNLPEVERYFWYDWVRGGPGTGSSALAFGCPGEAVTHAGRLKFAKPRFWPHEAWLKLSRKYQSLMAS
jgi:hypothetical protein